MSRAVWSPLVLVLLGSGCAVPLAAKITGVEGADTINAGNCRVVAAPVTGMPTLESAGYSVDVAAWNEKLAAALETELKGAGVKTGEGDPVEIGVVGFTYRTNPDTWAMEVTFEIAVSYREYSSRHKTFHSDDSITSSSTQTAWDAGGAVLNTLLKDAAFLKAIKGS